MRWSSEEPCKSPKIILLFWCKSWTVTISNRSLNRARFTIFIFSGTSCTIVGRTIIGLSAMRWTSMLRETNIIGVNQFIAVSTMLITAATTSGGPDTTISSASTSTTARVGTFISSFSYKTNICRNVFTSTYYMLNHDNIDLVNSMNLD